MTNYELGAKTQLADGRVTFNAAVFFSDIDDLQVIADAGSCSSRIVLNAQAEVARRGARAVRAAERRTGIWACRRPGCRPRSPRRRLNAAGAPIAGIRDGNRLPTSPEFQASASVTYSWPFSSTLEASRTSRSSTSARRTRSSPTRSRASVASAARARRGSSTSATRRSPASRSSRSCRLTRSATCASA